MSRQMHTIEITHAPQSHTPIRHVVIFIKHTLSSEDVSLEVGLGKKTQHLFSYEEDETHQNETFSHHNKPI